MAFNKKGREKGKCLSEELKGQIVDKILETDLSILYEKGKCLSEELKGQIVDKILETDLSILLTSIFPSHKTFLSC